MKTLEPERLLNALEQSATAEIMATLKMRVLRSDRTEALLLIKNVVETADRRGLSDEQCDILYERMRRHYAGSAINLRELPKDRWLAYANSSLAGSQTTFMVRLGSEIFHARPFRRSNRLGDEAIMCIHGDKRTRWLDLDQVWRVLPGQAILNDPAQDKDMAASEPMPKPKTRKPKAEKAAQPSQPSPSEAPVPAFSQVALQLRPGIESTIGPTRMVEEDSSQPPNDKLRQRIAQLLQMAPRPRMEPIRNNMKANPTPVSQQAWFPTH